MPAQVRRELIELEGATVMHYNHTNDTFTLTRNSIPLRG